MLVSSSTRQLRVNRRAIFRKKIENHPLQITAELRSKTPVTWIEEVEDGSAMICVSFNSPARYLDGYRDGDTTREEAQEKIAAKKN
jgi:hypothetical protein